MAHIKKHGSIIFTEKGFRLEGFEIEIDHLKDPDPENISFWKNQLIVTLAENMLKTVARFETSMPLPAPVWYNFSEADRINRRPDWQTIDTTHEEPHP